MTQNAGTHVVMLLAGAGPSGDLALAFERLGATVTTLDAAEGSVMEVTAAIAAAKPAVVVAESPEVPAETMIAAADLDDVDVYPTPRSARLAVDREGLRKLAADELGLPTVPFWFAGSPAELHSVVEHAGFPLVVSNAHADAGRSILTRPEDVEAAWQRATGAGAPPRVIAETVVEIDDEVTLLTARTIGPSGPVVHFCEPIGHRRTDGGPLETWQPHLMSAAALDAARSIAARIVNSLGGRGVFGVELLVRGDEVYFAGVRPRPEEVGLVTLRSQRLSQFELHARAILGLPLDTIMISPAAAEIHVGGAAAAGGPLAEALAVQESDVRVLGDVQIAMATAPDTVRARDRAHRVSSVLRAP